MKKARKAFLSILLVISMIFATVAPAMALTITITTDKKETEEEGPAFVALDLVLETDKDSYTVDEEIEYTITLTNNTKKHATDVRVINFLSAGLKTSDGKMTTAFDDLAPGESASKTVYVAHQTYDNYGNDGIGTALNVISIVFNVFKLVIGKLFASFLPYMCNLDVDMDGQLLGMLSMAFAYESTGEEADDEDDEDDEDDDPPVVNTFTVSFNTNGGSTIDDQLVEEGKTATEPENPTKDNFIFVAWCSDEELTTTYDFSTPITEDLILYAKWESDQTDPSLIITIDQEDFTTTETTAKLSGSYVCNNLNTIAYEVAPFFYETGSSTTGEVIIDGNRWETEITLKPGENIIYFKIISLDDTVNTAQITVIYNVGNSFEYSEEDISEEDNVKYINNVIGIMFEDGTPEEQIDEIVSSLNGEYASVNYLLNKYWIKIEKKDLDELRQIAAELEENNECIILCAIDYVTDGIQLAPNDVWLGDVDATDWNDNDVDGSNWGLEAIEAQYAWDYLDRMSTVKVGVIDNGFSVANQDLDCFVLSEENSVDTDVDHGTHVSGTIGGTANNYRGHTGVMYNKANLLCYDVSPTGTTILSNEIESGIIQLVLAGAKVINMSLGCSGTHDTQFINDQARNASALMHVLLAKTDSNGDRLYDFIIVQSAGNSSVDSINNGWFASITAENCIHRENVTREDILNRIFIVAAAEQNGSAYRMCDFSNSGSTTNIAAPGRLIFSTDRTSNSRYVLNADSTLATDANGNLIEWSGTSMAAPHVTGVVGLVWAINPNFTGAEVKDIILNSTRDLVLDNPNSTNATGNHPLVNAKLAVEEAILRTDAKGILEARFSDAATGNPLIGVTAKCINYEGHSTEALIGNEYVLTSDSIELQLPAGIYTFTFSHEDYISVTYSFTIIAAEITDLNNISLSKEIGDNEVRIKLHWGKERPSDLDSHFNGKRLDGSVYHVFYSSMGSRGVAWLDVDDISYEGPETITINMDEFSDFTYSIHNFSDRYSGTGDSGASVLANSGAYIEVIIGTATVATYHVPTNRNGTVWNVFKMNSDGEITFINTFEYNSSPSAVGYVEVN